METIKIINSHWHQLAIQVRIGNQYPAELNTMIFDSNLIQGQEIEFQFDSMLYYRRASNPDNHNGQYTAWVQCWSSNTIDNP